MATVRPSIGGGAAGGAVMLPSLDTAPPPMAGLGAAASPMGSGGFDLAGAFGGGPAGGSISLGAAVPYAPAGARSMGDQRRAGERAQLRATSGLGAAAAPSAPPMEAPPSALQSALGEREGELSSLYDILATPKQQVRVANAMRPIEEMGAQQFYGGGQLELQPFVPPPIEAGEDEFAYMQRVQALQVEDEQRQVAEAQTLGDVRDIGASGHLGSAEARLQAREGQGAAELAQLERVAEVQKQAAEMSSRATAEAKQADIERRDFATLQRDAITQQQQVQQAARTKLQALPELDPNRTFKSQSGGDLFWAILGNVAGGAIGSTQVNDMLRERAQQDLEAQKANAAQTFDAANAADAAVGQQMGLYRELLGAAGDEAAADAMFLQLQLEDASRLLEAEMARTTIPVAKAELQQSLVDLRGQIDEQQRVIETRLATTPASFLKTYDPLPGGVRKKLEDRALRIEKERTDFQKMGVEGEEKGLERDLKREIEGAKASKKMDTKTAEQAYAFGKDVEKIDTAIGGLDELLAKPDIEGYGFTGSPLPEFASPGLADTNAQINMVLDELARLKSGAAIGKDEWEMYDGMLRGGTAIGGEERLRSNLERVRKFLASKRDSIEKGLDPNVRSYYRRNANLADFETQWTGGSSDAVVEED
jgi:hypothetical protein